MEKISIVKRRKKKEEPGKAGESILEQSVIDSFPREINNNVTTGTVKNEDSVFEEVIGNNNEDVSIELTPEQSTVIKSTNYIKDLLEGISDGVKLDIRKGKDGKVFFNFHFKPVYTVQMLNTKNVCEMLQISKSYLSKLVKTNQIKSYKIGRGRRFSLEDILDYLNRSQEI